MSATSAWASAASKRCTPLAIPTEDCAIVVAAPVAVATLPTVCAVLADIWTICAIFEADCAVVEAALPAPAPSVQMASAIWRDIMIQPAAFFASDSLMPDVSMRLSAIISVILSIAPVSISTAIVTARAAAAKARAPPVTTAATTVSATAIQPRTFIAVCPAFASAILSMASCILSATSSFFALRSTPCACTSLIESACAWLSIFVFRAR